MAEETPKIAHGAATRPQQRQRRYRWDHWFDGKKHELKWGRDFDPDPPRFRRQILAAAKRMGADIQTTLLVDESAPIGATKRILLIEPRQTDRHTQSGHEKAA